MKLYGAPGCDETAVNCLKHKKRLTSGESALEQRNDQDFPNCPLYVSWVSAVEVFIKLGSTVSFSSHTHTLILGPVLLAHYTTDLHIALYQQLEKFFR